jgi:hypothetical protein
MYAESFAAFGSDRVAVDLMTRRRGFVKAN